MAARAAISLDVREAFWARKATNPLATDQNGRLDGGKHGYSTPEELALWMDNLSIHMGTSIRHGVEHGVIHAWCIYKRDGVEHIIPDSLETIG